MKVITFYSFKGGVGRTTSLLALAYTLARIGRKVVVADWDLEAPGLSFFECMRPKDGGLASIGVLDYLKALRPENRLERTPVTEMLVSPRLMDDARERGDGDSPYMNGDLLFIPAGNLDQSRDQFLADVEAVDQPQSLLRDIDSDPRMPLKLFRNELNIDLNWRTEGVTGPPDYLLVDSRTGFDPVAQLLLGDATDFTVIVYGQDEQNLEGLRFIFGAVDTSASDEPGRSAENWRQPWDLYASTILICNGSPQGQEHLQQQRRELKSRIRERVCQFDSLGVREAFPEEFQISYNPELVLSNEPLVHRFPSSDYARFFADKIAPAIEERCLHERALLRTSVTQFDPRSTPTTEEIELQLAQLSDADKQWRIEQAATQVELTEGLMSLLYNPPAWNICGIGTPQLIENWPENLPQDNRLLFIQLIAYSTVLNGDEKRNLLSVIREGNMSDYQLTRLLSVFLEARSKFCRISASEHWYLLKLVLIYSFEWLIILKDQSDGDRPAQNSLQLCIDETLHKIIAGDSMDSLNISQQPLFPMLFAEALDLITTANKNRELSDLLQDNDAPAKKSTEVFLRKPSRAEPVIEQGKWLTRWLRDHQIDIADLRIRLFDQACKNVADDYSDRVQAYCFHQLGDALWVASRSSTGNERADLLDRAIRAYSDSCESCPNRPATLHNKGIALLDRAVLEDSDARTSYLDQAIAVIEESLKLRPRHAKTLDSLGVAFFRRGCAGSPEEGVLYFDKAIEQYSESVGIDASNARVWNNLGNAHRDRANRCSETQEKKESADHAIRAFRRSLRIHPDDRNTLRALGRAYFQRSELEEAGERSSHLDLAIAFFRELARLQPHDAAILNELCNALLQKRYEADSVEQQELLQEAASHIEKAFKQDPAAARYNYACVQNLLGNKESALEQLRVAIDERPEMGEHAAKDRDFESLHGDPEFNEIVNVS